MAREIPAITEAELDALLTLADMRHISLPACCASPADAVRWEATWYGACEACPLYAQASSTAHK
jgi:hypothetical protein